MRRKRLILLLIVIGLALTVVGTVSADGTNESVDVLGPESTDRFDATPTTVVNTSDRSPERISRSLQEKIDPDHHEIHATDVDQTVRVRVQAAPNTGQAVKAAIEAQNGNNTHRFGDVVYTDLPSTAVRTIAERNDTVFIGEPIHIQQSGTISENEISEGVGAMNADRLHDDGITGENTTIAVIDQSFNLANPKYEDQVVDTWGSDFHTDQRRAHGTASAEVVSDVAPGAELVLVSIAHSGEFHQAVEYLRTESDVDVVTMSLAFAPTSGPIDGTDPISEHISQSQADGLTWFSAAGNRGEASGGGGYSWHGEFVDTVGDHRHEFASGDNRLTVSVPNSRGGSVYVTWDANWARDGQRYAVHLYEVDGDIPIDTFYTRNPVERVIIPAGVDEAEIEIERIDADGEQTFVVFAWDGIVLTDHWTPGMSIEIPATSDAVTSVGAVHHDESQIAPYSSRGPTVNGRYGIDMVAPSAVSQYEGGIYTGTSAAAPHAAGAGALVLDANPELNSAEIRDRLTTTAFAPDGENAPPNDRIGYGHVDAYAATTGTVAFDCGVVDEAGVYEVHNDIAATSGCLTIADDDITIDGNGQSITGIGEGSAVTIDGAASNVTITNLTLESWETGIDASQGVSELTVTETTFEGMNATATVRGGANVTFDDVSATDVAGNGLSIRNTATVELTAVEIEGSDGTGVDLRNVSESIVTDVSISAGDDGGGLYARNVTGLSVHGGTISGASKPGLWLDRSTNIDLTSVTLSGAPALSATGETTEITGTAVTIETVEGVGFTGAEVTLSAPSAVPSPPPGMRSVSDPVEVTGFNEHVDLTVPYRPPKNESKRIDIAVYDGAQWTSRSATVRAESIAIQLETPGIVSAFVEGDERPDVDDDVFNAVANEDGEITPLGLVAAINSAAKDGKVDGVPVGPLDFVAIINWNTDRA